MLHHGYSIFIEPAGSTAGLSVSRWLANYGSVDTAITSGSGVDNCALLYHRENNQSRGQST